MADALLAWNGAYWLPLDPTAIDVDPPMALYESPPGLYRLTWSADEDAPPTVERVGDLPRLASDPATADLPALLRAIAAHERGPKPPQETPSRWLWDAGPTARTDDGALWRWVVSYVPNSTNSPRLVGAWLLDHTDAATAGVLFLYAHRLFGEGVVRALATKWELT